MTRHAPATHAPARAAMTSLSDPPDHHFASAGCPGDAEDWHATLDAIPGNVALLDDEGVILAVNAAWRAFAAAEGGTSDLVGANYLSVCDAADAPTATAVAVALRDLIAGDRESFATEYPCHSPIQQRWYLLRARRQWHQGRAQLTVSHENITERHLERQSAQLNAHLLDQADVAVQTVDVHGGILSWNAAAERLFGWTAPEAVGRPVQAVLGEQIAHAVAAAAHAGTWTGDVLLHRLNGAAFPAHVQARLASDLEACTPTVVVTALDISQRVDAARELEQARDRLLRVTDSMGEGMYTLDVDGRVTYMNRAAQELLGWRFDELDGHAMHDITHFRRPSGEPHAAADCPILRAARYGETTRVEDDIFIRADGAELPISYTASPLGSGTGLEGCVVVFEDITERKAQAARLTRRLAELEWLARVHEALEGDLFVLHAQPIIELSSGRVVQRELLIRMRENDGTDRLVPPGLFLPVAEEHGLIGDIDRWVIDRGAELAAGGVSVELNLSARSIGERWLLGHVVDAIARTGADPARMTFEITETALIRDEAEARRFVEHLHKIGCKVVLDDFGAGYSGFKYLKQLPIDSVKIDIEFVRDLVTNTASRNVVEAIVGLAAKFGLDTVAEGVEDAETLQVLTALGVDYAQGYHLGRPAPVAVTPAPGRG
ncbi:MAG TPA: EAL domain-containing protein [Solirubrobacteraceae bacterium]|nr:EAL domain-containing protein [Solirubrobacteraceae bacterium]